MTSDTFARRWRLLFSRLNQVESRSLADDDQLLMRAYVEARVETRIRPQLLLRPRPGARSEGPSCTLCAERLSETSWLVACTACLRVYHRGCLAGSCPNCTWVEPREAVLHT